MQVPALQPADVKTLTLDEALKITLDKNRDIQKAEEYKNKVMGMYVEQRAAALPQITGTAVGARSWDFGAGATEQV